MIGPTNTKAHCTEHIYYKWPRPVIFEVTVRPFEGQGCNFFVLEVKDSF